MYKSTRAEGFGQEAKRRIILGTFALSHGYYDAYYNKAIKVREEITKELKKTFETVDAIVTPTTPSAAFKFGEKSGDPVAMYLCDIFAVPANIAGVPAISVPSGKNRYGMPLGIQFMSAHFTENTLFMIAEEFEKLV